MIRPGNKYLFFTVTHYVVGEVVEATPTHAILKTCAWIPQTGRLNACLTGGTYEECEPMLDGTMVPLAGTIVSPWPHALPTSVR